MRFLHLLLLAHAALSNDLDDVDDWEVQDVRQFVTGIGKSNLWADAAKRLADAGVDGAMLSVANSEELQAFGLTSLMARKLLQIIENTTSTPLVKVVAQKHHRRLLQSNANPFATAAQRQCLFGQLTSYMKVLDDYKDDLSTNYDTRLVDVTALVGTNNDALDLRITNLEGTVGDNIADLTAAITFIADYMGGTNPSGFASPIGPIATAAFNSVQLHSNLVGSPFHVTIMMTTPCLQGNQRGQAAVPELWMYIKGPAGVDGNNDPAVARPEFNGEVLSPFDCPKRTTRITNCSECTTAAQQTPWMAWQSVSSWPDYPYGCWRETMTDVNTYCNTNTNPPNVHTGRTPICRCADTRLTELGIDLNVSPKNDGRIGCKAGHTWTGTFCQNNL